MAQFSCPVHHLILNLTLENSPSSPASKMAEVTNLRPANAFVHVFDSSTLPPVVPAHPARPARPPLLEAGHGRGTHGQSSARADLGLVGRREGKSSWISNAKRCKHVIFIGNVRLQSDVVPESLPSLHFLSKITFSRHR